MFRKQTDEVITITFDFSALLDTGETITGTPSVSILGPDSVLVEGTNSNTTTTITASFSAGTADANYNVSFNTGTTAGGSRSYKRHCTIQVRDTVV